MRIRRVGISAALTLLALGAAVGPTFASPGDDLRQLMDDVWAQSLEDSPLFATQVGESAYDHLLSRVRLSDIEAQRQRAEAFRERLSAIDREALERQQQIDYDFLARNLDNELRGVALGSHMMPFTTYAGFYLSFPGLPDRVPLETVENYENYISRLAAFATYVDDHLELLRAGIETGRVLPRSVLDGWEGAVTPHIVDDPEESLLWAPLEELPESFSDEDAERLRTTAREAIESSVVAGYRVFEEFLRTEYLPATRETVGASALPDGDEYYQYTIGLYTTTDLTADEIHRIGLDEVARIRAEMLAVIDEVGFDGDFDDFVEFLRTDPRFYAETPEELLEKVSRVLKKMDGKLPELFRVLPRMPYGIKEIPDYLAPKTTTAYYGRPAGDGTRAGTYWVNTYDLPSRPFYEIEALSFHEAVPGHHLQIALAQELEGLHPIRRFAGVNAYVEGWALYSERLGLEVGFYEDPYSNFGRLSYEMWRALRLVVDTGMHAKGWSRQQAIDYMAANSALTLHNITAEVDRYISWPGQALGYKIGELKIRELRAHAEETLGGAFDLREFHEVVLRDGAVPLSILEDSVHLWLQEKAEAASRAEGNPPSAFDTYWMVFLMRGDRAADYTEEELADLQRRHLAHLSALGEQGALVAGPFEVGETEPMRGIVLFPGDMSEEEIREMAERDPMVKAGRLRVEIRKWWTGAGVLAFPGS